MKNKGAGFGPPAVARSGGRRSNLLVGAANTSHKVRHIRAVLRDPAAIERSVANAPPEIQEIANELARSKRADMTAESRLAEIGNRRAAHGEHAASAIRASYMQSLSVVLDWMQEKGFGARHADNLLAIYEGLANVELDVYHAPFLPANPKGRSITEQQAMRRAQVAAAVTVFIRSGETEAAALSIAEARMLNCRPEDFACPVGEPVSAKSIAEWRDALGRRREQQKIPQAARDAYARLVQLSDDQFAGNKAAQKRFGESVLGAVIERDANAFSRAETKA